MASSLETKHESKGRVSARLDVAEPTSTPARGRTGGAGRTGAVASSGTGASSGGAPAASSGTGASSGGAPAASLSTGVASGGALGAPVLAPASAALVPPSSAPVPDDGDMEEDEESKGRAAAPPRGSQITIHPGGIRPMSKFDPPPLRVNSINVDGEADVENVPKPDKTVGDEGVIYPLVDEITAREQVKGDWNWTSHQLTERTADMPTEVGIMTKTRSKCNGFSEKYMRTVRVLGTVGGNAFDSKRYEETKGETAFMIEYKGISKNTNTNSMWTARPGDKFGLQPPDVISDDGGHKNIAPVWQYVGDHTTPANFQLQPFPINPTDIALRLRDVDQQREWYMWGFPTPLPPNETDTVGAIMDSYDPLKAAGLLERFVHNGSPEFRKHTDMQTMARGSHSGLRAFSCISVLIGAYGLCLKLRGPFWVAQKNEHKQLPSKLATFFENCTNHKMDQIAAEASDLLSNVNEVLPALRVGIKGAKDTNNRDLSPDFVLKSIRTVPIPATLMLMFGALACAHMSKGALLSVFGEVQNWAQPGNGMEYFN